MDINYQKQKAIINIQSTHPPPDMGKAAQILAKYRCFLALLAFAVMLYQ